VGELERGHERDPILISEQALVAAGVERERLDELRADAERAVTEALQRAKGWPDPDPEARFEHVFVADTATRAVSA
jgi:TPP-dependent pyruvate/acetoin dehydrogenase alpha subunit